VYVSRFLLKQFYNSFLGLHPGNTYETFNNSTKLETSFRFDLVKECAIVTCAKYEKKKKKKKIDDSSNRLIQGLERATINCYVMIYKQL
jgi:hypothetical protein